MRRRKTVQCELDLTIRSAAPAGPGPAIEMVAGPLALRRWVAGWLANLPPSLERRGVVLVPSEVLAHQFRRHVAAEGQNAGLLLGVTMQRPLALAASLLSRAGHPRVPGHETVRRLLLSVLFESRALGERLRYFKASELATGRGYVDAFARVISDLEAAGLAAADLTRAREEGDSLDDHRLADVALVWEAVAEDGARLSSAGLLAAATAVLRDRPEIARAMGPMAAVLVSRPTGVLLGFLDALPDVSVAYLDARPHRPHIERWRQRAGETSRFGERDEGEDRTGNDLARLKSRLFAAAEESGEPPSGPGKEAKKPRAAGGTVGLAMTASVSSEVDRAAAWVIEEIARGTPVDATAIIVPDIDTYAPLIIDRLGRLALPEGAAGGGENGDHQGIPVSVAGGLRASRLPAGLRLAALFKALESLLEADHMLRLLPWLRSPAERPNGGSDDTKSPDGTGEARTAEPPPGSSRAEKPASPSRAPLPPSPSRAAEIIFGAGIVGGREARGDEWSRQLRVRRESVARALDEFEGGPDEPEKRRAIRDRRAAESTIVEIDRLLPAIAELEEIAARVRSGATLAESWSALSAFVRDWLKLPPLPPNLPAILESFLGPLLDHPAASRLTGVPAIQFLGEQLDALRLPAVVASGGGGAAVCVATPAGAAGLVFTAVRVLGLAEGVVPRAPHDDPIIPDALRATLEERLAGQAAAFGSLTRVDDLVLEDLKNIDRTVCGTRSRLVLTAPRQWLDRSEREMSGIFLEVAMALHPEGRVPTLAEFKSALGRPRPADTGGGSADEIAAVFPPSAFALVKKGERTAATVSVPSSWIRPSSALDLKRLVELDAALADAGRLGAADGHLGPVLPATVIPGLTPARPISATGLGDLLACPYQFFQMRILGRREPLERPSFDTIDALNFGALVHSIAEAFFGEHGPAFCRQEGELETWIARIRSVAERQFTLFLDRYPLRGANSIEREQERVRRQAERLVRHEWDLGPREYVGAELVFGDPEPVALELGGGVLHVEGAIDRIDLRQPGELELRDLKTGRPRDLSERPMEVRTDLQLGVYTLALDRARVVPDAQVVGAAYVYASTMRDPERRFEGDALASLRLSAESWMAAGRSILAAGAFARTPNLKDCDYCAFKVFCGDRVQARTWVKLESAPEAAAPLREYKALKRPEGATA